MSGIVFGYDDSNAARAAMRWAKEQARLTNTEILVVYVMSSAAEWELAAVQINPDPIRHGFERRLRGEWTQPLRNAAIPYRTVLAVGRVADELMRVARDTGAELIVIGMTPRGSLTELVNRSSMHQLRSHAVRPVVAVPAEWPNRDN